ncbi:MAG TPA: LptE family protein [Bacteroidales bacterium]|nr:LptE family protein [Bacteroidales bacterium]HPK30272.1 LptE family protein [Bacteroidales bacterium]
MRRISKILLPLIALLATATLVTGCWLYSFSGTSIQPDVKTICIEPVQNRALKVNPSLANSLHEALTDKYRKLTRLEQVEDAGDLYVLAVIEGYDVSATAITADEVAARNRLTVTVKVKFVNEKYPEENFEKNFAGYEDYDSDRSLDEVEATLCDTIIEKIVEDIFNATVANW